MANTSKERLSAAFIEQLSQKDYRKITVSTLCSACNVSRMTFYYYFRDLDDLVAYTSREEARKLLLTAGAHAETGESSVLLCHYMQENSTYIYNLYHAMNREKLEMFIIDTLTPPMRRLVLHETAGLVLAEEDIAALVAYHTSAVVAALITWVGGGMKEDPEEIVAQVEAILRGGLREAAQRLHTVTMQRRCLKPAAGGGRSA